jgi:hypothetical protein
MAEGSASDREDTRLGRRPAAFGKIDLTVQLQTTGDLLPEREAAKSVDGLCRAMRPFLDSLPAPPNVVAVISGRKPLTRKFLRALHCAFGLHTAGLPLTTWLHPPDHFRWTIEALFIADPRVALRRIAAAAPWVALKTEQLLGAGAPANDPYPGVRVGDTVQVKVVPPMSGHILIVNADPHADTARFYWLDPWLECVGRRLDAMAVLPSAKPFVPIGPPPDVVSSVIAIVTDERVISDWTQPLNAKSCPEIALCEMRRLAARVLGQPASKRAVAIYDYRVLPARSWKVA